MFGGCLNKTFRPKKEVVEAVNISVMSGALVLVDFGRFLGEALVPLQFFFPSLLNSPRRFTDNGTFRFFYYLKPPEGFN